MPWTSGGRNYQLDLNKQQDTMTALGGFNKDIQGQQQANNQQNQAKDQFNTSALNNYSQYMNTNMNNQNQLQTQGLGDYSNYMNQGQANQQQRFNAVDSQMYQQQQFNDNQQQQNTQFLENHPMTMQYNNGNQTQTFTQSLRNGGRVQGHYAPGGPLGAFPVKGPMGHLLHDNPIQQMSHAGLSAQANEPGGYGYTLQHLGEEPSPWDPSDFINKGKSGTNASSSSAVSGQGNLSPTATGGNGGNITFNPVINTGDGNAKGGEGSSGSSGNTAPIGANSGTPTQIYRTGSSLSNGAGTPAQRKSTGSSRSGGAEVVQKNRAMSSGADSLDESQPGFIGPHTKSYYDSNPTSTESDARDETAHEQSPLAITQGGTEEPRNGSNNSGNVALHAMVPNDKEHNASLSDSQNGVGIYSQEAAPKGAKYNPDSYVADLHARVANGLASDAAGALGHRNYVRGQDPYRDGHFNRSLSEALPDEIALFNQQKKAANLNPTSDQENEALWTNHQKSIQYDNQRRVNDHYNTLETSTDPKAQANSIGELNRLGILRKQGDFLHKETRPMRADNMETGPEFRQKLGGYGKGYEDIANYIPEKPSAETLAATRQAAGPFAPPAAHKKGGSVGRQSFAFGGMPFMNRQPPAAQAPRAPQPGFFTAAENGYSQNNELPGQGSMGALAGFGASGLHNEQIQASPVWGTINSLGQSAASAYAGKNAAPSENAAPGENATPGEDEAGQQPQKAENMAPKLEKAAMLRRGGIVQSFREGGCVSDQPIFTRAGSLKERSTMDNHPFKTQNRSQQTSNRFGNYGGFEVSNDDDCPRLNLPFKPGFSR